MHAFGPSAQEVEKAEFLNLRPVWFSIETNKQQDPVSNKTKQEQQQATKRGSLLSLSTLVAALENCPCFNIILETSLTAAWDQIQPE